MRIAISLTSLAALAAVFIPPQLATAEDSISGDGYCDYVEGVAAAQSALKLAPQAFTELGYIEQSVVSTNPDIQSNGLRLVAGLKYQLTGLYEGSVIKDRASADCRRHQALEQVRGETLYRALDARVKVLDAALVETDKLLQTVAADLEARRTTAQEATATRLRVEELRQLSTDAHNQMSTLPKPTRGTDLSGALTAFQRADDEVEVYEGKQRWIQAFDVSLRAGVDEFLDRTPNPSPYFGVITVGINLGTLLQGGDNDRAAAGRRRLVRSGHDPLAVDATVERLKALVEAEAIRLEQTATLEADLKRQLDTLGKVGGDESRRYRQTVWFDWIKVQAEHAYLDAHLAALKQVLGQ
jgi:hypothetical protein